MPSQRTRKRIVYTQVLAACRRRAELSIQSWDSMPAVGREFGSREWDRLQKSLGADLDLESLALTKEVGCRGGRS